MSKQFTYVEASNHHASHDGEVNDLTALGLFEVEGSPGIVVSLPLHSRYFSLSEMYHKGDVWHVRMGSCGPTITGSDILKLKEEGKVSFTYFGRPASVRFIDVQTALNCSGQTQVLSRVERVKEFQADYMMDLSDKNRKRLCRNAFHLVLLCAEYEQCPEILEDCLPYAAEYPAYKADPEEDINEFQLAFNEALAELKAAGTITGWQLS